MVSCDYKITHSHVLFAASQLGPMDLPRYLKNYHFILLLLFLLLLVLIPSSLFLTPLTSLHFLVKHLANASLCPKRRSRSHHPLTTLSDPSRQAAKLSTLSTFQKGIQAPRIGDD